MENQSYGEAAARLSGFLYATSSLSGGLRSYENFAYFIEINDDPMTISDWINAYYRDQFEFLFEPIREINKAGDLEYRMRHYLIRDDGCIVENRILEIQQYLSFRIMDMVADFFDKEYANVKSFELREKASNSTSSATFFCVMSSRFLLVLQFNQYVSIP